MKTRLFSFIFFVFALWLPTNGECQFAYLVDIQHWCSNEDKGAVEFALNGNPSSYTYYWTHGPTTLSLDCLLPGHYTLVVVDENGCVEIYEVEILNLAECTMESVVKPVTKCRSVIEIIVWSGGVQIPESALNIVWDDGDPSGLVREVTHEVTAVYCVSISGASTNSSCCELDECFLIEEKIECTKDNRREVIVNETNRPGEVDGQFVELLVIGDGECGGVFDLRGFIVDDNNGYLIPGNDFITPNNTENIGIDNGFLVFGPDSNWEAVPNGSLIIIHDGQDGVGTIPPDDPYDSDGDGVYVLQANNTDLFWASSGTWNPLEKSYDYMGFVVEPAWSLIEQTPNIDGMQVRYPDGSFSHGISLGESAFSGNNDFFLWMGPDGSDEFNVQYTGTDYYEKTDFDWSHQIDALHSPGLANSVSNQELIASLRDCSGEGQIEAPVSGLNILKHDGFLVYPNPFSNDFEMIFQVQESGEATACIYSASGQIVFSEKIPCTVGTNKHLLKTGSSLRSGAYLLKLNLPSGDMKNARLIRVE